MFPILDATMCTQGWPSAPGINSVTTSQPRWEDGKAAQVAQVARSRQGVLTGQSVDHRFITWGTGACMGESRCKGGLAGTSAGTRSCKSEVLRDGMEGCKDECTGGWPGKERSMGAN